MSSDNPRYGKVNKEMIRGWLEMDRETDGPFYALNLMKYRKKAVYADGRESDISGSQADDEYNPMRILKDLGARIVFFGEVMEQTAGEPLYDRIAVVLYPTRMKFMEMQRRPDFVDSHEHKDAGMEFTIVASTSPITEPHEQTTGTLALVVEEAHSGTAFDPSSIEGATLIGTYSVEGQIVGDERKLQFAHWIQVENTEAFKAATEGNERLTALTVSRIIDEMVSSQK